MGRMRVYVGTWNQAGANPPSQKEGIFWFNFDTESGRLDLAGAADAGPNPAFLTFSADGRYLYAINEVTSFQGKEGGGVSAFAVDKSGSLTHLNSQPTFGGHPCYISLDRSGRWAMVSNYRSGNVVVYPIGTDGRLGVFSVRIQHEGKGSNPARQEGPHAHSIQADPSNRWVLAADLGLDQVRVYALGTDKGTLTPHTQPAIQLHAGAGPRHLDFHPNGRWLYIINELDSTVAFFETDLETGRFHHRQTLSTLPGDYEGEKWAADIHVHPSGRFVFASNRGHDSIAILKVDPARGELELAGLAPSGGRTPRNFAISPGGEWLLVANQDANNLVALRVDTASGQLSATGDEVNIPAPVCVRFMPSM